TQYARDPIKMQGGTTFYFVTDGILAALDRAKKAANGKDVRLGGGAATMRQYLQAGLVDKLHIVQSPVLLGAGERLFDGLNLVPSGYSVRDRIASPNATHVFIEKNT
ncbi:MAG TPA: dihydrofolate reductase family protein, partial [Candidatus Acidoferrum sp.]|nr:dihydrofolate reductase family protein [Candidatus Acidoferrum sp.]